jgi:hypothetical protein
VWVHFEEGLEKLFTYFDNSTKTFKFYDDKIKASYEGLYNLQLTIGDDHWLGSLARNYTFQLMVRYAPVPIFIPVEEDVSSKGAKVTAMGVSGDY